MNKISELKKILGQQLNWHKARVDFFAQALVGMFICRTINFAEIAVAMPSKSAIESRYKRIRRFFSCFEIDFNRIAQWLFALFFSPKENVYIALVPRPINILIISGVCCSQRRGGCLKA